MKYLQLIKPLLFTLAILVCSTSCTKDDLNEDRNFSSVSVKLKSTTGELNKVYLEIEDVVVDICDWVAETDTVQELLDMPTIGALDIRNQCSGFVYAISIADQYIKTGMYKNILVIGSEVHSTGLDMTDRGRGVSVIFGDGAGAAVLSREEDGYMGISKSAKKSRYCRMSISDETSSIRVMIFNKKLDECKDLNQGMPKEKNIVIINIYSHASIIINNQIFSRYSETTMG